jgi:PIN domain nuclease of toxin-antitoxin system
MKLLLDTSYFLSYFKIAVEGLSFDFLKQLMERKDIELLISEISYSELVAKSFKLCLLKSNLLIEEILSGLDSVRNESRIELLSWYKNPRILETAFNLRKIHTDFFDCIIFASAFLEADAIGTFDDVFYKKIKNNKDINKIITDLNPEFKFYFYDFKEKPKGLIS